MNGIADTGYLVALANSRDGHHAWAMRVSEQVTEPLLTCEPVLAETAFHLGNVGWFWRWSRKISLRFLSIAMIICRSSSP